MVDVKDDGSVGDLRSDRYARDREPTSFTTLIAERISQLPEGHQRTTLQTVLNAHSSNQDRRAAVLRHPDLAKRMADTLGLARPEHWTGYIAPHVAVDDDGGLLRSVTIGRDGTMRTRFHQLGARSCGMVYNNTPERAALLEISAEAWHRENNLPITPDN